MSDDLDAKDVLRFADLADGPLVGHDATQYNREILELWEKGLPPGSRTGWRSLDHHYTVAPGQLTIVTGWPGSGKSEWLDALLTNLARQDWRFAIFSAENKPTQIHIVKFLEKVTGKPFGAGPTERMSKDEAVKASQEIADWFGFLSPAVDTDKEVFGIEEILKGAELHFRLRDYWKSKGFHCGLVIDPWNEIEHNRPRHWSETEYISATLTTVRQWARANGVHVWIVAHPQKLRRNEEGKLPVPAPDSISGSQHWWNKADNAITVYREFGDTQSNRVTIYVQKVRFKHIGKIGAVELEYDRITGRYYEPIRETGFVRVVGNE